MAGIRQASASEFDALEAQAADNTPDDELETTGEASSKTELKPEDFENHMREMFGDEYTNSLKDHLSKKGKPFSPDGFNDIPKWLEDKDKEITRLRMKLADDQKKDLTFQPPDSPQPMTQGGEQVDPFLMGFAQNPRKTLRETLREELSQLAHLNQQQQKFAMELEDQMLESMPEAPQVLPMYQRFLARGMDPELAWYKAETMYRRNLQNAAIRKMTGNRTRAERSFVEGSGGPGELPSEPDWANMTAAEMEAEIKKRGGYKP